MNEASYIIGSFALWAGDYDRAKEQFSSPPSVAVLAAPQRPNRAVDLIARAREERHGQIVRLAEEFHKHLAALPQEYREIAPGGLSLRGTRHLAAVVLRTGVRQFEMRAYLTDLSWSKQLLENAHHLASQAGEATGKIRPRDLGFIGEEEDSEDHNAPPTGFSWESPGKLFIEIHVSRLGLIPAHGFWTERELPESYVPEKAFHDILAALDPTRDNERVGAPR